VGRRRIVAARRGGENPLVLAWVQVGALVASLPSFVPSNAGRMVEPSDVALGVVMADAQERVLVVFTQKIDEERALTTVVYDPAGENAAVRFSNIHLIERGDFDATTPAVAPLAQDGVLVAVSRDEGRSIRVSVLRVGGGGDVGLMDSVDVPIDGLATSVRLVAAAEHDSALLAVSLTQGLDAIVVLYRVAADGGHLLVEPTGSSFAIRNRTTPALARVESGFALAILHLQAVQYLHFDLNGRQLGLAHPVALVDVEEEGVAHLAMGGEGAERWIAWTRRGPSAGLVRLPLICR
jgi:hypothetical protein